MRLQNETTRAAIVTLKVDGIKNKRAPHKVAPSKPKKKRISERQVIRAGLFDSCVMLPVEIQEFPQGLIRSRMLSCLRRFDEDRTLA